LSLLGTSTENAYLDQDWGSESRSYKGPHHPLQENYRFLFKELQENPEDVCASNLIFKRSGGERGSGYPELAKICWPVHEAILEIVRPSAIITFGRQPFEFVAHKLGGGSIVKHPSGHGTWEWQSLIKEGAPSLVGLPHLSRYALRNHPKVMEKIQQLIG
jgi:uracil-DNA glycosylase